MDWYIASDGVKSYLHKQNHVIDKINVKHKAFGFKFYAGLMVKEVQSLDLNAIFLDKKPQVKSL